MNYHLVVNFRGHRLGCYMYYVLFCVCVPVRVCVQQLGSLQIITQTPSSTTRTKQQLHITPLQYADKDTD